MHASDLTLPPDKHPTLDTQACREPVRPFFGLPWQRWLLWRAASVLMLALDSLWFRIQARGTEHLPKDGPLFVLANHTATFDPAWLGWAMKRPMHYMAATSVLRIPVAGRLLVGLGAFGKKKFVKDRQALLKMMELYKAGQAVVIFPEGMRTWNGEPGEPLPGMGSLIRKLGARVVYVRIETAFLAQPRWATYPRRVPVEVSYEGPYTYGKDWSPVEIEADIAKRIRVTPRMPTQGHCTGRRMAWGLPSYLWACPVCFADEGLRPLASDGNQLSCRACGATWRLDLQSRLHGQNGAPDFTLPQAAARLVALVGAPPVVDRARFDREGLLLEARNARVLHEEEEVREEVVVAAGCLRLHAARLEMTGADAAPLWTVALTDVTAVSVEVANQIFLRVGTQLFRLDLAGQSNCKWGSIIRAWVSIAKGADPASVTLPPP